MITRYSSSMFFGICVTFALFFFMQFMVAIKTDMPSKFEKIIPHIPMPRNVIPPKTRPRPEPRPEPVMPEYKPEDIRTSNTHRPVILPGLNPPPVPTDPTDTKWGLGFADGDIQVRAAIQPVYPRRALDQGLEGYVVVSFDVTKYGGVMNPVVLESSHHGFEKSALTAIQRFKYKPRMIDGEATAVSGVKYKFSFELES